MTPSQGCGNISPMKATEHNTEGKAMKRFKILGTNGDQDVCDICGRVDLQKVVWLEDSESGQVFAAGTVCAAKMAKWTVKEIKSAAREADNRKRKSIMAANSRISDAACKFRDEWSKRTGRPTQGNFKAWHTEWLATEEFETLETARDKIAA